MKSSCLLGRMSYEQSVLGTYISLKKRARLSSSHRAFRSNFTIVYDDLRETKSVDTMIANRILMHPLNLPIQAPHMMKTFKKKIYSFLRGKSNAFVYSCSNHCTQLHEHFLDTLYSYLDKSTSMYLSIYAEEQQVTKCLISIILSSCYTFLKRH